MKKSDAKLEKEVKVKLKDLRDLRVQCDAVAACGAFTFDVDMKIKRLGARANVIIEDQIGIDLDTLKERHKQLFEDIGEDQSKLKAHPKFKEYIKVEEDLWKKEIQYAYNPVEVTVTGDEQESLKEVKSVTFKGNSFQIDAYASFLDLVEKEFINIK